jgi:hypothetical protein
MFMAPIVAMRLFHTMIIWITCMMGIYITNMTITGTNAPLMAVSSTPNTNINTDQNVATLQFLTVTMSTTYTTATYTPPTATTGTNTNPVLLVQNRCVVRN